MLLINAQLLGRCERDGLEAQLQCLLNIDEHRPLPTYLPRYMSTLEPRLCSGLVATLRQVLMEITSMASRDSSMRQFLYIRLRNSTSLRSQDIGVLPWAVRQL